MDRKPNHALVGLFVILTFVASTVFIVWISRAGLYRATTPYDIYFTGSVTGLQVGSAVRYRGVPVGTVKEIKIDPQNVEKIRVNAEIDKDIAIKEDAIATLETMGLTGLSYVQINGGSQNSPLLTYKGRDNPVIPSRTSRFEEVVDSVPAVLHQAGALIQDCRALFTPEVRESFAKTLKHLEDLTHSLVSTDGKGKSIGDALRDTAVQLKTSLQSIENVFKEIDHLVEDNRGNLARFFVEAANTLNTFDRIGKALENSPGRFFSNDPQQGVHVR